ncbi:MAG: hypothetical protein ACI9WU_003128 [Myxococcota bacterium]|jgi:hypothetical protein
MVPCFKSKVDCWIAVLLLFGAVMPVFTLGRLYRTGAPTWPRWLGGAVVVLAFGGLVNPMTYKLELPFLSALARRTPHLKQDQGRLNPV